MTESQKELFKIAFREDNDYTKLTYKLIKCDPEIWNTTLESRFCQLTGLADNTSNLDILSNSLKELLIKKFIKVEKNITHREYAWHDGVHDEYEVVI